MKMLQKFGFCFQMAMPRQVRMLMILMCGLQVMTLQGAAENDEKDSIADGVNALIRFQNSIPENIFDVVKQNDLDKLKLLLANGANVNRENYSDECKTALMYACENKGRKPLDDFEYENNLQIIKLLIENGADIDAKTRTIGYYVLGSMHHTPLMYAWDRKDKEIIKLLLMAPSKIDKSIELYGAVLRGCEDIVDLLLQVPGINVNQKGCFDETLLIAASQRNFIKIVQLLLAHGADMNFVDRNGKRAEDYANPEIRAVFEQAKIDRQVNIDMPVEADRARKRAREENDGLLNSYFPIKENSVESNKKNRL